jgi:hypothetical protein
VSINEDKKVEYWSSSLFSGVPLSSKTKIPGVYLIEFTHF